MAQQKVAVADTPDWTLTAEQATAVDQLASGKTVSEIAEALEVSPQTVSEWCKSHLGVQAALNGRRHEIWRGTADRLRTLLPKALEVLELELQGEDRLQAAVHVLKACRLYGTELPLGPTDVGEIVIVEKERLKQRQQREFFANIPSI
jgi:transposase-like protein